MIDLSLGKKLSTLYKSNAPYPYIVIDNFLPEYLIKTCKEEVFKHDIWHTDTVEFTKEYQHKKFYYPNYQTSISEFRSKLPITSFVLDYLNSQEFLKFLEELTGHTDLHRDPALMGGGIHRIKTGGKLAVHKDYQEHPETRKVRVLNLLIYLNENWKSEWGGNLELWSKDLTHKVVEIEPIFNRAVIFDISNAPHGHPKPLNSPEDTDRFSLALYYFTDEVGNTKDGPYVCFFKDSELGIQNEIKPQNNLDELFK